MACPRLPAGPRGAGRSPGVVPSMPASIAQQTPRRVGGASQPISAGSQAGEPVPQARNARLTEAVTLSVRDHELEADWPYRETARLLHDWFDRFNAAFFEGLLPLGFLSLEPGRRTTLSRYQAEPNDVGALHRIRLNTRYAHAPLYALLGALLRQMVAEWQALYGKPARHRYVNRQFAAKCGEIGILCDAGQGRKSATRGYAEPFVSLLREHGVDVPENAGPLRIERSASATMKRWRCSCTRLWAATPVHGFCRECNEEYRRDG